MIGFTISIILTITYILIRLNRMEDEISEIKSKLPPKKD